MVAWFAEVIEREETLVAEAGFEPATFEELAQLSRQRMEKCLCFSLVNR
jgi:hypothetical protein